MGLATLLLRPLPAAVTPVSAEDTDLGARRAPSILRTDASVLRPDASVGVESLEVAVVGISDPSGRRASSATVAPIGRSGSMGESILQAAALIAVVAVMLVMALAGPAAAADLTPEQQKLAAGIDGKLIAPCCWTQTVALHESQKAEEIKMQVRLLIAQGKGESEIIDGFVTQYGEQILASPRASGFNWLAYLIPFAALVVGLGGIAVLVARWRGGQAQVVPVPVTSQRTASGDNAADELNRRLEDDLSRFDS